MAQAIRSDLRGEKELPALYYRVMHQMTAPALLLCDPEGRIASWNRGCEAIFGWKESEVRGRLGRILFTPEDIRAGQFERESLTAAERGIAEDVRWHAKKDGSRVFISGALICLRDDDQSLLGYAKVLMDTTQSQLAYERTAARLLDAQEDERRRIARELHDDLSQRLAVLDMGLMDLGKRLPAECGDIQADIEVLRSYVGPAAIEVRRLSHELHPSIIHDLGLAAALQSLVDASPGKQGRFVHDGAPHNIPAGLALVFYRIAQEALRNVAKYAETEAVVVTLSGTDELLCLSVEDSGCGFDAETVASAGGLGLKSMQERAQLVGGTFSVASHPGQGTRIDVRAPLHRP